MNDVKKFFASAVISELQQSDIYLTVKARLFETPGANLNGVRVTAQFIDDIIDNQDKYVGLPLYADVKNLLNGNYEHLGHLYDPRTGEFHSVQIGSFYEFEKEETSQGFALIGYARVPKRNKALAKAIGELFTDGSLKFSFQISCASYRKLEDGTTEIDADASNHLEGMAIVSFPACENAVALDLVAEFEKIADEYKDGEKDMHTEDMKEVIAEEQSVEETVNEVAEQATEEETAEVVVRHTTMVVEQTSAYDTNTGAEVCERNEHVVTTHECVNEQIAEEAVAENEQPAEEAAQTIEESASCKKQEEVSEEEAKEEEKEQCAEEEVEDEEDDEQIKEKAEIAKTEMDNMISSLEESIRSLKAEIESIRTELNKNVVAEINPFVSDINIGGGYTLLDSTSKRSEAKYSLLDRA